MSKKTPRPAPSSKPERTTESRQRRSATHDYWPRDFWDVAPESGTEARPAAGDRSTL